MQVAMDEDISWIIDSGCSTHMTGSKKQFVSLRKHKGSNITFGGGSNGHIRGLGKVKLNRMIEVEDVNYVENLLFNLLSVSQLCNNGRNKVVFYTGEVKIKNIKTKEVIIRGI